MNIAPTLQKLWPQETLAIATLQSQTSAGLWRAQTQSGNSLILKGSGSQGSRVYYNSSTQTIISTAPNLPIMDIEV